MYNIKQNNTGALAITTALLTLTGMVIVAVSLSSARIGRLSTSTDVSTIIKAYNSALALRSEILADGDVNNFYTPDASGHCNPSGGAPPIWDPSKTTYLYCIDDSSSQFIIHTRVQASNYVQLVVLDIPNETFETSTDCFNPTEGIASGVTTFTHSNHDIADLEGTGVAISGNRIITGSPGSSNKPFPPDGPAPGPGTGQGVFQAGLATIYEYNNSTDTWTEWHSPQSLRTVGAKIAPKGGVDIYGDYAVAGANFEKNGNTNAGAVYVYHRQGEKDWSDVYKINPPTYAGYNDFFGQAVALECTTLAVGVPGRDHTTDGGANWLTDTGAVYVYEKLKGQNKWVVRDKLLPPVPDHEVAFGQSIAISGDTMVVGASQANRVGVVNAPPGKAFVFKAAGNGKWNFVTELVSPNSSQDDRYGQHVAIDGNKIVVAAHREDTAVGPNTGQAYYWEEVSPGNWVMQNILSPVGHLEREKIGSDVAIEGNTILVSAVTGGTVYHYEVGGPNWPDQETDYPNPVPAFQSRYGTDIDIHNNNIVVGRPQQPRRQGSFVSWELP